MWHYLYDASIVLFKKMSIIKKGLLWIRMGIVGWLDFRYFDKLSTSLRFMILD